MHKRRLWLDPLVHEYLSEPGGCDQPRVSGPITSWHCGEEIAGVEGCRQRERETERLVAKANQDGGSGAGRKRGTLQTIPSPRKAQVMVDDN